QYGWAADGRLLPGREAPRSVAELPNGPWGAKRLAEPRFRSLGFVDARGRATALMGSIEAPEIDAVARGRLLQGKPLAWIAPGQDTARIVLLLPTALPGTVLAGEVDPHYLSADSDQLPA